MICNFIARSSAFQLLFLLLPLVSYPQEYFTKQYRVDKGLPSDIIKACTQDSLGYFWIATDNGLTKYDGVQFTTYRKATHSNYVKGFLRTRSGRLFAFGDLDILEIKNTGDSVVFERQYAVSRQATDSSLSYPKNLYEDVHGDLWASESQAVVRMRAGKLERFDFDIANRSTQFVRSFTFFEDRKGDLYTVSIQGNVFRFNTQAHTFEKQSLVFPGDVEFVSAFGTALLIGSTRGVFQSSLHEAGGFSEPVQKLSTPNVSYIERISDDDYFIATRSSKHFIWTQKSNNLAALPVVINNINHVYLSREKDIWISGNEGLVLIKHNLFQKANGQLEDFIESIAEDPATGDIYYANKRFLYKYNPASRQNTLLLDIPDGYFQSLTFSKNKLWIANAFHVLVMEDGKIIQRFDFSSTRRFVTELSKDSRDNIWVVIPGDSAAHYIDASFQLHTVPVPLGKSGFIHSIREGKQGMFLTASGADSYLFTKAKNDLSFRNISLSPGFPVDNDFDVHDLITLNDNLWLATSHGLVMYTDNAMKRIDLGIYTDYPVVSISVYGTKLLVANAMVMLLFDPATGATDLFNEGSGLLSNTITPHGLLVDRHQHVWVGTSKGLCYSTISLDASGETPTPRLLQVSADGRRIKLGLSPAVVSYGSFVTATVSPITFPENEVTMQYRILPDEHWTAVSGSLIEFPQLNAGDYAIEIRAKKNGPYAWSNTTKLSLTVDSPFWRQWSFYVLCLLALALFVVLTILIVNWRNERRNRILQALVDQRTQELKIANDELINLNIEKNNLIGIVAHDLKSPLKQILGLLSIMKLTTNLHVEPRQYVDMIEGSANRLDGMISKILDIEAIESKKLNILLDRVNLSNTLSNVASRYGYTAAEKQIHIVKQISEGLSVEGDSSYLDQVLDNLVSNAIKFSPPGKSIFLNLTTDSRNVICEIKDQGPGLTEDDKSKLFGKFQKLSARPTGGEVSTGLGLSIVKKYIEAMHGEIWCESVYGQGASFFVSFQAK